MSPIFSPEMRGIADSKRAEYGDPITEYRSSDLRLLRAYAAILIILMTIFAAAMLTGCGEVEDARRTALALEDAERQEVGLPPLHNRQAIREALIAQGGRP